MCMKITMGGFESLYDNDGSHPSQLGSKSGGVINSVEFDRA